MAFTVEYLLLLYYLDRPFFYARSFYGIIIGQFCIEDDYRLFDHRGTTGVLSAKVIRAMRQESQPEDAHPGCGREGHDREANTT